MGTNGLVNTMGRIVMIGVLVFLLVRWLSLDRTQQGYLKSILRDLPHLPGRYAV